MGNKTHALNIAGIGFDGHVIKLLTRQRKKWNMKGKFSYATAICTRIFFLYKTKRYVLLAANFRMRGRCCYWLFATVQPSGHGLQIQPGALFDDGLLSIALFGKVSLIDYVRNLSKLKKGIYAEHPEVTYFSTKGSRGSKDRSVIFCEADGELVGQGVLTFRVVPSAIQLLDVNYTRN